MTGSTTIPTNAPGPSPASKTGLEHIHTATSDPDSNADPASPAAQSLPKRAPKTTPTHLGDAMPNFSPEATADGMSDSGLIKYKIEYVGTESGSVFFDGRHTQLDASKEPPVFEYVEVRLSSQGVVSTTTNTNDIPKTDMGKGHPYINILSPAVAEALRCVVDYFPDIDLSTSVIKVPEPYSIFVFFEKELTEYRERVETIAQHDSPSCPNRWAAKHIGVVQKFVREQVQEAVNAERARHARGYATFDMLWLLYKPGSDVYADCFNLGEHNPYVLSGVKFNLINGTQGKFKVHLWNIAAHGNWVGSTEESNIIMPFAGEKKIPSLEVYPCEYLRFSDDIAEEEVSAIRQHFVDRGRKWSNLRRKLRSYYFDGFTTNLPRRSCSSLVIPDAMQFLLNSPDLIPGAFSSIKQSPGPLKICTCKKCEEAIYQYAVKPKFKGYDRVNPRVVGELTDHQYFLCSRSVDSFAFKTRSWERLDVEGFREPSFDSAHFERLVMKSSTKELIKNLTQMYMRDSTQSSMREERSVRKITQIHKTPTFEKADRTWSADFIEGKGEGLTMLLHGRPGVGKTYTAECIADYTERPLLSLTCSDIGVSPEDIEENLLKWFKLAESWGAIILIDEADIYMEERQVQDIERNHLVAGFLRALEYYKGILFLTTNRVGTFDEAFMSRIHVQIHYPEFEDDERGRLWDGFFDKLEEDREATMRITQSAKDYVQSQELQSLKWNGREIRNSFQVAVALAEAQGQKDKQGRVLIKSDHIKATVQMSREFRDYLVKLHKGDMSKKASLMGNRYDAYGKETASSEKY